jgi:hypothetical protein
MEVRKNQRLRALFSSYQLTYPQNLWKRICALDTTVIICRQPQTDANVSTSAHCSSAEFQSVKLGNKIAQKVLPGLSLEGLCGRL